MLNYSLGMFSVHELTSTDMDNALKQVADLGFRQVEFAGFFGHSAEEIKDMLDKYGLTVSSTHTPMKELVDAYDETIAYHRAIGNKYIVFPMEPLPSQEAIDVFVKTLETLMPRAADDGITLCYHNHLHEFSPNVDGSMIYEQIIDRTKLFLEIDNGWAFSAGQNPVEMMTKYADRLKFIHLRDSIPNPLPVTGVPMMELYGELFKVGIGKPLGEGQAPVREAFKKARELGVPMVIESEAKVPDGIASVKRCLAFAEKLEAGE